MIYLKPTWPFFETSGVRRAKEQYEDAVKQRPKVDKLADELIQRGKVNHFAEDWERILRKGRP